MKRAYEWQGRMGGGKFSVDLVRVSDGAAITSSGGYRDDPAEEALVSELERLALENETLRSEQDARTTRLKSEVENLRAKLVALESEAKGQVRFLWPAKGY